MKKKDALTRGALTPGPSPGGRGEVSLREFVKA